MTGDELGECLRTIGGPAHELARRLGVRADTVRHWLAGRRPIPENLAKWLTTIRDGHAAAGPLPEGWGDSPAS